MSNIGVNLEPVVIAEGENAVEQVLAASKQPHIKRAKWHLGIRFVPVAWWLAANVGNP